MVSMQISQIKTMATKDIHGFILDLNPASGHGGTIKKILDDSLNPHFRVQHIITEDSALSFSWNELHKKLLDALPDIAFLSLSSHSLPQASEVIKRMTVEVPKLPIIAVVDDGEAHEVIDILRLGVADFMIPPLKASDVSSRVWRLLEQQKLSETLIYTLKEKIGLKPLIGKSPAFLQEINKIPIVTRCDSSVLISGETGTGKEMFARTIHYLGPRSGKPFTPLNCGAIPSELIENELFGHAKGAYTNAVTSANGIIHETDGGTLLLDEIDCLTLAAQVKLLRFLQEKEYRQLGSANLRRADVRIIAATNIDLGSAVNQGRFRRDLYYRLNIIPLALPPLRERCEDIPVLARHFVEKYAFEFSKEVDDIAPEAMQKLLLYDWPGNVRELQNIIERAVVFSSSRHLRKEDIHLQQPEAASPEESFQQAKAKVIVQFEKSYIHGLLVAHRGNITHAARTAGKNRRAFWELMRKHEIDMTQYRVF